VLLVPPDIALFGGANVVGIEFLDHAAVGVAAADVGVGGWGHGCSVQRGAMVGRHLVLQKSQFEPMRWIQMRQAIPALHDWIWILENIEMTSFDGASSC
jgi:hypothetical protein